MCIKTDAFWPGDEFGNSKFGIPKPWTLCAISEIEIRPEKTCFYRIRCAAGPSEFWENRDIFGHFFSEMSQICKVKKCKNAKCKSVPKTPEILVFLSKIGLWRFVEALKKCRKWHRNPVHTCAHFFSEIPRGIFGVFRDFQLRIEVKFRKKGVFRRFLEKFSLFLRFTGWRSTAPFLHGAKIWTSLFRKVRNTFSVLGPICAAFTEKIRPDENDDAYRLPYRPLVGGQFSTFFCSDSWLKWRQKKSERFCSTII
jgi:hypothetical protein